MKVISIKIIMTLYVTLQIFVKRILKFNDFWWTQDLLQT